MLCRQEVEIVLSLERSSLKASCSHRTAQCLSLACGGVIYFLASRVGSSSFPIIIVNLRTMANLGSIAQMKTDSVR